MKKIILAVALVISGLTSLNAQTLEKPKLSEKVGNTPIKEGNWLIGGSVGSIGYSFEKESFAISLNPSAGYFITDGIAVGLKAGVDFETVKNGDNIWGYKILPFARYYFPEGASETGRFFGQGEIGITGSETGKSDTSFAFGINGGYSHFVSRNVALELIAGYNYSKSNLAGAEAQSGLGLAVGFQIFLGN